MNEWCQDLECSRYGVGLDEDGKCHGHTVSATSIVKDIVTLTDRIKNVEASNNAWCKLQKALSYLSAKDTMLKFKRDRNKEEENDSDR